MLAKVRIGGPTLEAAIFDPHQWRRVGLEKNTTYMNILVCNVTITNSNPVKCQVIDKRKNFALFKLGLQRGGGAYQASPNSRLIIDLATGVYECRGLVFLWVYTIHYL